MPRTVTIRLPDKAYEIVRAAAEADRRSIANLIETATLRHLEEHSFMEAVEAGDILSDRELLRRLRAGHAQATARKGRFVRGL
jgi:predicted DNA-binding protein